MRSEEGGSLKEIARSRADDGSDILAPVDGHPVVRKARARSWEWGIRSESAMCRAVHFGKCLPTRHDLCAKCLGSDQTSVKSETPTSRSSGLPGRRFTVACALLGLADSWLPPPHCRSLLYRGKV